MPQQLLEQGYRAFQIEGITDPRTGEPVVVYAAPDEPAEVTLARAREQVDALARIAAAKERGGPMIGPAPSWEDRALRLATDLLPDIGAGASMLLRSNPLGALVSILGAGAGELLRTTITGDEFDPLAAAAPGMVGPPMRTVRGTTGQRLLASTFKPTEAVERRFQNVDGLNEIIRRRLLPNQAALDALALEKAGAQDARRALLANTDVMKFPAIDELLDLRRRLEPLAQLGRADLSELDNTINMLLQHPESRGPLVMPPVGGTTAPWGFRRDIPGSTALDTKVNLGMGGANPAFRAQDQGRLAGTSREIDRALQLGLDRATHQVPGVDDLDRQLQAIRAITPVVRSAARKEAQRAPLLVDQRFGVGAPFAGGALAGLALGDPRRGLAIGSVLTPLSIPLALLAGSPLARAKAGYALRATSQAAPSLEAVIRAILAGTDVPWSELQQDE